MAMSGFICHDDYLQKTAKLTDEEIGRLFRALMRYHATGVADEVDGRESIAFDFIREDIDRTDAAYKAKCEKNRNIRLAAIANERQQPMTNVDDCPQKEKEKEEEYKNKKENDKRAREQEAERFAKFWAAYPRKEAKPKAQTAFAKLHPDDDLLATMLAAIERQKASDQWQEDGGRFIPHPTTWLNNKRWEDQLPSGKKATSFTAHDQRIYTEEEDIDAVIERFRTGGQSA